MKVACIRVVVTAVLALVFSCVGFAQMMVGASPGFLMIDPSVRQDLALTPDQAAKVEKALQQISGGTKTIRFTPGMDMASLEKSLTAPLTAGQKKRLNQIWIQQNKGRALANPEIQKELGFTDKQKTQIGEVQTWLQTELRSLAKGGGAFSVPKELMDQASEKYMAILTPAQKESFTKMQGKPFTRKA